MLLKDADIVLRLSNGGYKPDTEVKIGIVSSVCGKDDAEYVKNNWQKGSKLGYYLIPTATSMETKLKSEDGDESDSSELRAPQFRPIPKYTKPDFGDSDLHSIPKIDKQYVPYGCYGPVRRLISSGANLNMYITGYSGVGKTKGVQQACAVEGRELIHVNISAETNEEDLIGTFSLVNGATVWVDGPVTLAMKRGAVLLMDELDSADANRIMCVQGVLNFDDLYIKKTNEIVKPAPGFCVIATGNTKGLGDGSDRYISTGPLNDALLERFAVMFEQGFPTKTVETKILKNFINDQVILNDLITFAETSRNAYSNGGSEYCITTRRLVQIAKLGQVFGIEDAIKFASSRYPDEDRDALIQVWKSIHKKT